MKKAFFLQKVNLHRSLQPKRYDKAKKLKKALKFVEAAFQPQKNCRKSA